MYCVNLAENAPFKSSGIICWSPPPSSLPDELSMDIIDSNGFFSIRRLCMARDRSYKTTGSPLIVAHLQISFLIYCANCWHSTRLGIALARAHSCMARDTAAYYAIACNVCMRAFWWLLLALLMVYEKLAAIVDMQSAQWTCCFISYYNKSHSAEGLALMVFIFYVFSTSIKHNWIKLKDEVGMPGPKSLQTRFVGIITSTKRPYACYYFLDYHAPLGCRLPYWEVGTTVLVC
jgi:hypothetical protein